MKKHLFLTALVLALVMCFSLGVCAHEQGNVVTLGEDDPNQYVITEALANFEATDDLWIGTLDQWIADGHAIGDTKTALVNGEAIHGDDIIITNGVVAIALAVETRNPWGYPAGSILDAGRMTVVDGKYVGLRDTVWSVEPLVNGWDSWAPNNCGVVTFDLVNYDFGNGEIPAVKVTRKYEIKADITVITYYGIEKGAEVAYTYHEYVNNDDEATGSFSHRFALTNKGDDGGAMAGVAKSDSKTTYLGLGSYGAMVATYGNNDKNVYHTALVMPGNIERVIDGEVQDGLVEYSRIGGSVGYKCVRVDSKGNYRAGGADYGVLAAGESRTYNTALVISDEASPAKALEYIADVRGEETINVAGTAPANATVIVKVDGVADAFGWFLADKDGKFAFELPAGKDYVAYVEMPGKDFGPEVAIPAEGTEELALTAGADKVAITLNLKDAEGNALYGKVEVPNAYPTVRYNGDSVFQAEEKGVINLEVAPGTEKVVVYGQGYWFFSNPVEVALEEGKTAYDVTIDMQYALSEGWLSGDNHHHGDKNDAFAAVKDLVPSMAASDIDVMFVTDHDFTTNNYEAYKLASEYEIEGFVPSEEISCSWAHFNVMPYDEQGYEWFLDENKENHTSDQFADLQDFVDETHDNHAAITANHPWYSYGLFMADYNEAIPGGYTDDFDCVEINACNAEEETYDTINTTEQLWNTYLNGGAINVSGDPVETEKAHYLVGGSDTHDVIYPGFSGANYENVRGGAWYATGKIRTIAYVGDVAENDLMANGIAFNNAALNGNSYVTFGPLLQMTEENIPGEFYNGAKFEVEFTIESLAELEKVFVLTEDATDTFGPTYYTEGMLYDEALSSEIEGNKVDYSFSMDVEEGETTWVAFLVMDVNGNFAITNPYWIGNTFPDVELGDWYYDAVTAMQADGIINGMPDGTFAPNETVTRAQFATMLYRAMDGASANAGTEVAFTDVNADFWAAEAIYACAAEGIITGYPDGSFKPNANISRAEMAVMIFRALRFDEVFNAEFVDVPASSWYYDAVMVLGSAGIVNGVGEGKFAPEATATRAQAAQILYNVEYMPQ
ncbi:MAG: S-layer homology domain-containing protein [Firmicutes bacterium]|nr:S-layer homology domain-containing protein [Bacillota bacterium]